jgi:hypothetical protein
VVSWPTTPVVGPQLTISIDWYTWVDADVGSTVTSKDDNNNSVTNRLIRAACFMPVTASLNYKRIIHLNFSISKPEDYPSFFAG